MGCTWLPCLDRICVAPFLEVGCFGSVHVNQLTDSGFKNQKNQSELIPSNSLVFYAGFEDLIVIFRQGVS